jgi:outer membrane protein assembly factor BamB
MYKYDNPQKARVLDARTGVCLWSKELDPDPWTVRTAANSYSGSAILEIADSAVWLVEAGAGELRVCDLATGTLHATVRPGGHVRDLQFAGGRMYVLTDSCLRSYDAKSGRVLWSLRLEGSVLAGQIIAR